MKIKCQTVWMVLDRSGWILWLVLLIVLPVTSSRQVAKLIGRTPVSPLALYPLGLLAILWLIPALLRGRRLPPLTWPLFAFAGAAIASSLLAAFLPIEPIKGRQPLDREIRSLVTLGVGISFYLLAVLQTQDEDRLRGSLRALYIGAILAFLWATLQAYYVLDGEPSLPRWLVHWHRQLVIRQPLPDRVTGLAYEPSWFANQIVTLYLPLCLGSALRGYSVFRKLGRRLSIEMVLAVWATGLLVLTFSRGGYVSLAGIIGVLIVAGAWRLAGSLAGITGRHWVHRPAWADGATRVIILGVAGLLLLMVARALAQGVSERDPRMTALSILPSQMMEIRLEHPGEVGYALADRLGFAERVIYWETSYRIFERFPIMGVGLGNAGFFFPQEVPYYGYGLVEITTLLDPASPLFPNPKNLWARLLAETGLVGVSLIVTWLALLWLASAWLGGSEHGSLGAVGIAGALAIGVFIWEGCSLDTFALPQLWIAGGLVTATLARVGLWRDS